MFGPMFGSYREPGSNPKTKAKDFRLDDLKLDVRQVRRLLHFGLSESAAMFVQQICTILDDVAQVSPGDPATVEAQAREILHLNEVCKNRGEALAASQARETAQSKELLLMNEEIRKLKQKLQAAEDRAAELRSDLNNLQDENDRFQRARGRRKK